MRHLLTDLRGNPISFASRRRQRRYRHPNLPALFYLVQNRDWEQVVSRASSHPHEILIQEDGSGNTPLHIACRLGPPENVVRALMPACQKRNAEGATALHIAASHRCSAQVISSLLESKPENENSQTCVSLSSAAVLTKTGRAPIHYACMSFRGLGVDAFRVLLDATIESGNVKMKDECEYEFHDEEDDKSTAPESMTVNVMTMRDCSGQTPLGLLFRRYRERVKVVIKAVETLRKEENERTSPAASLAAAVTVQADLGELWKKSRLIVGKLTEARLQREESRIAEFFDMDASSPAEAAVAQEAAAWAAERHRHELEQGQPSQFTTGGARKFRVVHASVGLTGYGCPPEMIMLAISIHPNQVREMDEDGALPLHIAAVASSYVTSQQSSNDTPANLNLSDEDSLASGVSFLSNMTPSCTKEGFNKVIKILLKHYPAAARIPHGQNGRLPLVLAIDSCRRTWNDGIKSLLNAYPAALESRRIQTKIYPSILALIGRPTTSTTSRCKFQPWKKTAAKTAFTPSTTLFELIKAKPDLVLEAQSAAREKARHKDGSEES